MKKILLLLKPRIGKLALAFVLFALSALCMVALPTLMTNVVDKGINAGDMQYVVEACIGMAIVTVADVVFNVVGIRVGNYAILDFTHDLRTAVFSRITHTSAAENAKRGAGALLTRTLEDVDRISDTIGSALSMMATLPVTLIAGTVLAFRKSTTLAWIMLAFTPVVLLIVFLCSRNVDKQWIVAEEQIDKQNGLIRSRLSGIRVVRAFNQEPTEQAKIEDATWRMSKGIIRGNTRSELIAPLAMLVLNVATVLIIWLGAKEIADPNGLLTAGGVLAVIEYVGMITSGILSVSYFLAIVPRFRINCTRVAEILSAEDENERFDGRALMTDGSIRMENVGFSYTGEGMALSDVTATIGAGETVAFIGGTGSGKSTLVRLLCALDQPTEGKIYFGDEDISAYAPTAVRKCVSCVRQRDVVFSGTLKKSVDVSNEHTDEEVLSAFAAGQMQDFVSEKEEGLAYAVEERGGNLSGGQKQRVCITRAFLKDAPIYLFDDSFSALDFLTESRLRTQLKTRLQGKTKIIVTQRVATAKTCDKILVFDAGKLVATGRHEELMEGCELYREIYYSQTGEEWTCKNQ